jgi:ABC-type lipoprotein export system ATPase subunit
MTTTTAALRAVDLRYVRGGRVILDGISLEIRPGTTTAITGPSGSGKSTLLALLAGLEPPDGGQVEHGIPRTATGLILQGHGLVSLLTAEENVALPLQSGAERIPAREVRRRARAALGEVHLADVAEHLVEALSGGQQQRVAIARALVLDPRLVLADEATASLDAENRDVVVDLLFARAAAGATVVLATHDERVAERADRVVRIAAGRLIDG